MPRFMAAPEEGAGGWGTTGDDEVAVGTELVQTPVLLVEGVMVALATPDDQSLEVVQVEVVQGVEVLELQVDAADDEEAHASEMVVV